AVWTAEELSADCAGNKRGSIFGAYAKLFVPYRLGDVNGDGTVNISDATLLRRYLAGYQVTDPERVKLCGKILHHGAFDGEITINDATEIQRYLAEFETASPIGREIESH
ncbi:MAG: dockerin type I repeat-containing protein, partial [Ruminococcus sp.]|nr:dockerin type I repeat-containing protein [Ruminococcus sp.]